MENRRANRKEKTTKKTTKYRIKTEVLKKWAIIFLVIVVLSGALVTLIFKDRIFKSNVIGEKFNMTQIAEYKDNVKKSKIERVAILSWSTNFETEDKEDIKKIIEFIESMEGYVEKSEIATLTSNTYGIVLYYKNDTNTVITISPAKFAVDDSIYYKNAEAYYTKLETLLAELNK